MRTWYYNGQKEIEIEFDGEYPTYFQCWYEDGTKKAEGRYKEFLVREPLRIWSKDGKRLDSEPEAEWNPLVVGCIAFVISYTATTIFNWLA